MAEPMDCPYCGQKHVGWCPRLKSVEYFDDGVGAQMLRVKQIEFHPPAGVLDEPAMFDRIFGKPGRR